MVRVGDKTYQVYTDLHGFGFFLLLLDVWWLNNSIGIYFQHDLCLFWFFEKLRIALFYRFLVKKIFNEKIRESTHIPWYNLLSIYKKMPRFHSLLSIGSSFVIPSLDKLTTVQCTKKYLVGGSFYFQNFALFRSLLQKKANKTFFFWNMWSTGWLIFRETKLLVDFAVFWEHTLKP